LQAPSHPAPIPSRLAARLRTYAAGPWPKWDGLKPLPDHVIAPLLHALISISRRPESRLILQPVAEARPPFWTTEGDYSVMWRGTKVGSVSYDRKPYGHGTRLDARPYASRFGLGVISLNLCCGASFRETRERSRRLGDHPHHRQGAIYLG
jgi:hypothetical protein